MIISNGFEILVNHSQWTHWCCDREPIRKFRVFFVQDVCTMVLIRGQLHFQGSPMDIGHGFIYGNCQGSVADGGVLGGEC